MLAGFITGIIAFVADLLAVNRKLMEEIQYQQRKFFLNKNK